MNLFENPNVEDLVLRDYQQRSVDQVRDAFRTSKSVVLQLPTGAGKSATSCHMIKAAIKKGIRCLFFADVKPLIDQTVAEFNRFGVEVGVQQGDHPLWNPHAMLQICTPQTIARRGLPKDFGFAVLDEIHHYHKIFDKVIESGAFVLGMSATPWRKGLGKKFGDIVAPVSMAELIDAGHLVNYDVFVPVKINMEGVKTVSGEFDKKETAKRADDAKITGDVVKNWLEHGENRKTIAFCHNIAHAKHLAREFQRVGVKARDVNCHMRKDEGGDQVKVVMEQFKKDEIKVLVSVSMLTKGFDQTDVECLIMAKPTKSHSLHVQMCGRGLRQYENSKNCYVFDHAGNMARLGFPENILITTLDSGSQKKKGDKKKKEKEVPLPKECPSCHCLKPASVFKCPFCGATMEHIQNVEVADGKLEKVKRKKREAREYSLDDKKSWLGTFNWILDGRGWKSGKNGCYGRALECYKDKFGCLPANTIPWGYIGKPTSEALDYFKHFEIKVVKGNKKKAKPLKPCTCGHPAVIEKPHNSKHKYELVCADCGKHNKFGRLIDQN